MRQAFIAITACGFIGVIWTLLRQPAGRVSWLVIAYFVSHAIFVLGIYWASGRAEGNSIQYFSVYQIGSFFPLIFAAGLTFHFAYEYRASGIAGLSASLAANAFLISLLAQAARSLLGVYALPYPIRWNLVLAASFLTCGEIAFFSLAKVQGDIESSTQLALAGFWTIFGLWHAAFAIGKLNPHLGWITRQDWIPTFAVLTCCLWMSYKLNTSQRELAFGALPDVRAMEICVDEPVYFIGAGNPLRVDNPLSDSPLREVPRCQ